MPDARLIRWRINLIIRRKNKGVGSKSLKQKNIFFSFNKHAEIFFSSKIFKAIPDLFSGNRKLLKIK